MDTGLGRRGLFRLAGAAALAGALDGCASPIDILQRQIQFKADTAPSPNDPSVSVGFEKLAAQDSWVNDLRFSVGIVTAYYRDSATNKVIPNHLGSAVLIDKDGTLFFTNHQANIQNYLFNRYEKLNPSGRLWMINITFNLAAYKPIIARLDIDWTSNDGHDLTIATIKSGDLDNLLKNGVRPVTLGLTNLDDLMGKDIITCGFPDDEKIVGKDYTSPINATAGKIIGFNDKDFVTGWAAEHPVYCNLESSAITASGYSGGGGFVGGKFIGNVYAGLQPNAFLFRAAQTSLLPLVYSLQVYQDVHPIRAAKLGITGPIAPPMPDSCKYVSPSPTIILKNAL